MEQTMVVSTENVMTRDITLEDYMANYAALHCEWVEGMVIPLSTGTWKHNSLIYFLHSLLEVYFELRPIGVVVGQPFVQLLPEFPNRRREPDLMVILETNPHELKPTYMDGPADICVEIVSEESTVRDHGEKLEEYEKGGVPEYWIIDPIRQEARFYRRDDNGIYRPQAQDGEGYYRTPALPGLALPIPTLWQDKLPGPAATVEAVRKLLE